MASDCSQSAANIEPIESIQIFQSMILPQQIITECSADRVEQISEPKNEGDNEELLDALLSHLPY